jgi:hypothetical protein
MAEGKALLLGVSSAAVGRWKLWLKVRHFSSACLQPLSPKAARSRHENRPGTQIRRHSLRSSPQTKRAPATRTDQTQIRRRAPALAARSGPHGGSGSLEQAMAEGKALLLGVSSAAVGRWKLWLKVRHFSSACLQPLSPQAKGAPASRSRPGRQIRRHSLRSSPKERGHPPVVGNRATGDPHPGIRHPASRMSPRTVARLISSDGGRWPTRQVGPATGRGVGGTRR